MRTHGYAPSGARCYGVFDWQIKGRTNVIGALIGKLLLTVGLYHTNVDANIFYDWTMRDLLPKLPQNSVVVMDNATFHKRRDIQNAILAAGHILEFLPTYSPDLNPIETKWANLKQTRKTSSYSIQDLFKFESFYLA